MTDIPDGRTQISEMTVLSALLTSGAFVPIVKDGIVENYRFDLGAFASRTIYADDYGAAGTGLVNDAAAIQAALTATTSGALYLTPGKTYRIDSGLTLAGSDVILDARGAIITSAMTSSAAMLSITGDRSKVIGGIWKLTGSSDVPWIFNITGINCEIQAERMVKVPDAGGLHMYVRHTADGFTLRNTRIEGSNGIYIEASNSAFLNNTIIGRASGGDDCFAIKALNDSVRNVRIEGNHIENLASGVSIGSEIGVLGANDATYSRTVGQVICTGNTFKNCTGIALIKPGGVSVYDYRDGTVEDVVISNNTLIDEVGTKFERGIAITPGRGARVRRVYGRNNLIRARTIGGVGRQVGAVDIYILDYAGGTAEADVSDVDLQVAFHDIYNGLTNSGARPGYPPTYVAFVGNATPATGTMSRIFLDIRGNGCSESGFAVGQGVDGAVTIRKMDLTNVNASNAAGQGGAYMQSTVNLGTGYWSVVPAAGTEFAAGYETKLLSQITSKDSGFTATGPSEAFPAAESVSLDVDSHRGRIVAWADGIGYMDVAMEGLTCQFRPGGTTIGTVDDTGLNLITGKVFKVNSVQVLAGRETGWAADTGTAKKTATATYAPGTNLAYSAAYVQAEQTATSTRLQLIEPALRDVTQEMKALKDALILHGLIGT